MARSIEHAHRINRIIITPLSYHLLKSTCVFWMPHVVFMETIHEGTQNLDTLRSNNSRFGLHELCGQQGFLDKMSRLITFLHKPPICRNERKDFLGYCNLSFYDRVLRNRVNSFFPCSAAWPCLCGSRWRSSLKFSMCAKIAYKKALGYGIG